MRVGEAQELLVLALDLATQNPAGACRSVHGVVVVGLPVDDANRLLDLLYRVEQAMGGPPSVSVNHSVVTDRIARGMGLGTGGKSRKAGAPRRRR